MLLLDRSGKLIKRETYHFRYPVLVVHETMPMESLDRLAGALKLAGKPGLVFLRRFTADEQDQIDHIVRSAFREEVRLRAVAFEDAKAEKERSERMRELRAFRFLEVPPVRLGPLLWAGPRAPYVPESATLERRASMDGLGKAKARYAYFARWRRLVELSPIVSDTGPAFVLRALADPDREPGPEPMTVPVDELPRFLPELFFSADFQSTYLGD